VNSWGTEVGISIVIVVLNVTLKLIVQILGDYELHWTRSLQVGQVDLC